MFLVRFLFGAFEEGKPNDGILSRQLLVIHCRFAHVSRADFPVSSPPYLRFTLEWVIVTSGTNGQVELEYGLRLLKQGSVLVLGRVPTRMGLET